MHGFDGTGGVVFININININKRAWPNIVTNQVAPLGRSSSPVAPSGPLTMPACLAYYTISISDPYGSSLKKILVHATTSEWAGEEEVSSKWLGNARQHSAGLPFGMLARSRSWRPTVCCAQRRNHMHDFALLCLSRKFPFLERKSVVVSCCILVDGCMMCPQ